jgi:hypothetical protein
MSGANRNAILGPSSPSIPPSLGRASEGKASPEDNFQDIIARLQAGLAEAPALVDRLHVIENCAAAPRLCSARQSVQRCDNRQRPRGRAINWSFGASQSDLA